MGFRFSNYSIALDRHEPETEYSFVSHAHYDHMSGIRKGKPCILSQPTKELIEARCSKDISAADNLDGVKLLNAGHVLGSRQLYGNTEGGTILYSGDYQMQDSYAAEKIELKQADTLIIDSTYPEKDVVFDQRSEVIACIQKFIEAKLEKGIVLFGAYSLGKSQELIKIANEIGVVPVVGSKISRINKVYCKFGVDLDYASADYNWEDRNLLIKGNFMAIVDPSSLHKISASLLSRFKKRIFTSVATGFAKTVRFDVDAQFALSDHADFKQAREYIDACNPKAIYTRGRAAEAHRFAVELQNLGYNASPLYEYNMQKLSVRA